MVDKASNPQVDFLQDEDDDLDLDILGEEQAAEESDASDSSSSEAEALDSAELDKVTGPIGTPDADAAPVVETPATPAPASEPAPVVAESPAPVVVQEVQQQPAAPTPAPSPAPASPSAADITKVYTDWRTETEDLLAKHHYKLSEEDMAQIDAAPQEVLPRMMARVYMDAVSAAITQVLNYLPQTMRQVNEQERINSESENSFFGKWPALKEHKDSVLKIGQVYRQMNPQASAEQFINEVGAAAMVSLRLDPSGVVQQPVATPAPSAPFAPAAQTPQGGIAAPQKPVNMFTKLNEEFDSYDEEIE